MTTDQIIFDIDLPNSLRVSIEDDIMSVLIARPEKRNSINDATLLGLERLFINLPTSIRCVIIHGEGGNFSAGLDLSEVPALDYSSVLAKSTAWHRVLNLIEKGSVPVIAKLHGPTIGGGLELACAAHIRIAEASTYYALPEGQRGIFVGGGGSVRITRLIGLAHMTDMMLTGRTYDAEGGRQLGLSQYVCQDGEGLDLAKQLALKISRNQRLSNMAILQVLPRIHEAPEQSGYVLEAVTAAAVATSGAAKDRLTGFLNKEQAKVIHEGGDAS